MEKRILQLALIYAIITKTYADNYPSLLTTNATIAVVIDHEYLTDDYERVKNSIETYLVFAKRELIKHGGVNVQFFSWTAINVKRDFMAILSVAPCEETWKLFHAVEGQYIFQMAITDSDCDRLPEDHAITIPMIPQGEEIPQIILDMRREKTFQWQSGILLYDRALGRDMVTRVITALNSDTFVDGIALSIMSLGNLTHGETMKKSVHEVLSSIEVRKLGSNFIAFIQTNLLEAFLEASKELKLVHPTSHWLYILSDCNENQFNVYSLSKLIGEGDNIAFFCNSTNTQTACSNGITCHTEELLEAFSIALDAAIVDEIDAASQVSEEEWEAIRPTKSERRSFLVKSVKSHLIERGTCDNCSSWTINAADAWGRSFQENWINNIIKVGTWKARSGASLVDELFPHVAHKFRGRTLPLVSFHNPPWQILKINDSGVVTDYGGIIFDVIKELSNRLNFTFSVFIDRPAGVNISYQLQDYNHETAAIITNSVPENIAKMITDKKVILAAAGFTVNHLREGNLSFTRPISIQTYTFVVSRPRELSRALLFMSPFTLESWIFIFLSLLFMGPILYYIHRYSPMDEYKGIGIKKGLSSVQNCVWYMYGALLQQGGMHLPDSDSARLIVGTWWLVVLVVVTTYCGNLVAFLTFPKIDIPITTVNEILKHRDTVTWGITKGTFVEQYLQSSDNPKFRALYQGAILHDRETAEIMSQVQLGKHVFIDWKSNLQFIMKRHFVETDMCDLTLGEDEFLDEKISMIISPENPYMDMINEELKRLHQVGLIDLWLSAYLPKRDRCFKTSITEVSNHTVNIDDMQGSLFVLVIGFSTAAFVILIEKLYSRHRQKREKRVIKPYVS